MTVAFGARSAVVTRPVAVNEPVTVGDAIMGDVDSTRLPEPVAALPKAAATPVPRPEMPVDTGRPVPLVKVTADGVPRLGVVSDGELDRTTDPVPVAAADPVPPLEMESGF